MDVFDDKHTVIKKRIKNYNYHYNNIPNNISRINYDDQYNKNNS